MTLVKKYMAREDQSLRIKTCLRSNLSTITPTQTVLVSNPPLEAGD